MMGLRKLSPGGHEHLTNSVACADRDRRVKPAELLSDHYLSRGYPAGEWFGGGAQALELSGAVTPAQMNALFGEGQHPHADAIEAEMIAGGATAHQAPRATRLGRRFPQYSQLDHLRSTVSQAYKDYNREYDRPVGAPISAEIRAELRRAGSGAGLNPDTVMELVDASAERAAWCAYRIEFRRVTQSRHDPGESRELVRVRVPVLLRQLQDSREDITGVEVALPQRFTFQLRQGTRHQNLDTDLLEQQHTIVLGAQLSERFATHIVDSPDQTSRVSRRLAPVFVLDLLERQIVSNLVISQRRLTSLSEHRS
ncbi:hypothetical protein GCM10023214_62320 [Amycolatopsis dongchuanensis]|uniref:TrwC relaxase domain-containing protein n=1 Tax=Amycolatopsis dongchuanensis TaxID=1070866 RepID=A0ABP8VG98_9PSEU